MSPASRSRSDAAAHARGQGLNVITGAADEAMLAGLAPFDVIVLLDVIEHLPDPAGTLALCERHLNPGGIIVIATGDFGALPARHGRRALAPDDAAAASVVLHPRQHARPGGARSD